MGKTYFNPGCALSIYKPELGEKILKFLNEHYGEVILHNICCHYDPRLDTGSLIINVCAGCDKRFGNLYNGISTISLWEVLDKLDSFNFPTYKGLKMSVHDACPVRENQRVHVAVRNLLKKMDIEIVETEYHGTKSRCCGDSLCPSMPLKSIHDKMKERAEAMPCEDVVVYCVSCIKSMFIGGKTPRYLPDLLFGEHTEPQVYDTLDWHEQLSAYMDLHS